MIGGFGVPWIQLHGSLQQPDCLPVVVVQQLEAAESCDGRDDIRIQLQHFLEQSLRFGEPAAPVFNEPLDQFVLPGICCRLPQYFRRAVRIAGARVRHG